MVPRRLLHSLLAVLALAAAPAAHAAGPSWHAVAPPVNDYPNAGVQVRFDPLGTAFGAWNGSPAQLATRPSAGVFCAPIAFPTSNSVPSAFGFAADGSGVFAGWDGTNVKAAYRAAGPAGGFGATQTIGSGTVPSVAVNASGQALMAWASAGSSSGAVNVAFRPAGAGSTFVAESPTGSPQAALVFGFGLVFASLAADSSGVVVYLDDRSSLQAVTRSTGGSWSAPARLDLPAGGPIGFAANTAGDAIVTATVSNAVTAVVRAHSGAFGRAEPVASASGSLTATSVAMAADGTALVALERQTPGRFICNGRTSQIYTAELAKRSGSTWQIVDRQEGHSGEVAASPTGDRLAFAWEGFVDPCVDGAHAINAQLGTLASLGGGAVLPDQPAQPPTVDGNFNTDPSVAIDAAGNALVTWSARRPPGGGDKLRVAAFDTGSAPTSGGSGGGSGGGGGTGGGDGGPPGPDFNDLLGLRAPVRTIPVDLGSGLPTNVFVDARCLNRRTPCQVNLNGVITGSYTAARASAARKRARATRFSIALPRVKATVRAGRSARLKLTIRGRALGKVRTALRAHGTAKLTIAMTVNGVRRPKPLAIPFVARRARRG